MESHPTGQQDTGQRGDQEFGTLPAMVTIIAERYGDRVAIEDGATTLSFAQLPAQVERATQAMIAHGIAPGDRVAIWAPNMWEWIVATLGLHSAGAILVPINTRYKAAEAAYMLRKAHVKMLLTVTDFLNTDYVALLQAHGSPPEALETTVVMRGHAPEGTLSWDAFLEHGHTVSSAQARERAAQVSPEDLSDILFTSGTTGQPKGAMCTHAQSLRAYRDWSHVVGLTAGDRYLVVAPFFHCFGYKAGWLAALMMGATVLPQPIFDPVAVMKRIGQDRVSMLPGPPALYQTLLGRDDLGQHDLSSLRLAVTGAAVIPVELIQRMKDELGFETVITGYGLTEACGIATMCRTDDEPTTIAQTSGRAIPDVEVKVVDTAGNTVEPNTPGEVMVRGYNVMKGYLDEPQQTEATLDADGWLHTGDIGVMDAQGYIRITDRKKDMFIMGGFNCYPAEIESLMLRNEDLVQAAVIGVPDARMGEVGMAFVTAREGAKVDEASIVAWCRKAMANFKVPRYIEVVEALPMNATGKVQKFVLRERAPGLLAARTTAEPPS